MTDDDDFDGGAPNPGTIDECPEDMLANQSQQERILSTLDELLADTGGAYSAEKMPIEQALRYSVIALNKQTFDKLNPLIQVLAQNVVGRIQYCEDALRDLVKPHQRTIRGKIKYCENVLGRLIGHLGQTISARTTFCNQMLADCQCRMLGGSQLPGNVPMGEGESGIPSQRHTFPDAGNNGAPSEHLIQEYRQPEVEVSQGDKRPIIVQVLPQPGANVTLDNCCDNAIQALARKEFVDILLAFQSDDPDLAMQHLLGTMDGKPFDRPDIGISPHPIEEEHYPIEYLD